MKRTLIGAILTLAAIMIALFGYFDLNKTSKQLIGFLGASKESFAMGNFESCIENAKNAVDIWNEAECRYKVYLNHEELDELELCFDMLELKVSEKENSDNDITELLDEGIFRLKHIINSQKPKISEIL